MEAESAAGVDSPVGVVFPAGVSEVEEAEAGKHTIPCQRTRDCISLLSLNGTADNLAPGPGTHLPHEILDMIFDRIFTYSKI